MTPSKSEQLLELLKTEPDDSFLNYALALEYAKSNDVLKAIELIEKVLSTDENYLGAYYQLGKYYEKINAAEKAIANYTKGIAIAKKQNNRKAQGELNEALMMLEE